MNNLFFTLMLGFSLLSREVFSAENLKLKNDNPISGLLVSNFSSQLSQLICAYKNEFESLRGEKLLQSSDLFFKSKIQFEGALTTEISVGTLQVDFGRFEKDEDLIKKFNELKDKISNSTISCGKLKLDAEKGIKEFMTTSFSQTWKIESSSDPQMKNLEIELSIKSHKISLEIVLVPEGGFLDDDDDW